MLEASSTAYATAPAMIHDPDIRLSPVEEIIADIAAGKMVVLVDEADRENEGDLVMAAEHVTPEAINFMARFGRGLICLTITPQRAEQLGLKPMVRDNRAPLQTAFTVSIEAAQGVTTGISAQDRATTVMAAVRKDARPEDLVQPGHIFPLIAKPGGVLVRAGHTEAGCDLAMLAGCEPASVICEILKDDGTMARLPDLVPFAQTHGLKIGAIADLIRYRAHTERLVVAAARREVQTPWGAFTLHAFRETRSATVHLALVAGSWGPDDPVLVRVHEPLSVVDLLDAEGGGHSWSLPQALAHIAAAGRGVAVLLRRPDGSASLLQRIESSLEPAEPVKFDLRNYGIGAQILADLGVRRMRLMAQPRKIPSMAGFGLEVAGFVAPSDLCSASGQRAAS